jgi:hypothetical protein
MGEKSMEADGKSARFDKYWAGACFCALLVGVGMRLALSNPGTNPILNDTERFHLVSQIAHYLFRPFTYAAVAALFTFRVIRMRFVGFWSIFFSFIIGGLLSTISLSLW